MPSNWRRCCTCCQGTEGLNLYDTSHLVSHFVPRSEAGRSRHLCDMARLCSRLPHDQPISVPPWRSDIVLPVLKLGYKECFVRNGDIDDRFSCRPRPAGNNVGGARAYYYEREFAGGIQHTLSAYCATSELLAPYRPHVGFVDLIQRILVAVRGYVITPDGRTANTSNVYFRVITGIPGPHCGELTRKRTSRNRWVPPADAHEPVRGYTFRQSTIQSTDRCLP